MVILISRETHLLYSSCYLPEQPNRDKAVIIDISIRKKHKDPTMVYGRDPSFNWLDVLTAMINYN